MTREGVDQLGPLFQNTEIPVQFVPVEGGRAKLVYTQDYGPKKAGMDASPEVPYTLDPEVGLHPVEILDSRNTNRRNIHFGNDITVVESNVPSTKGTNKQVSNAEYDARIAQLDEASDAEEWQKSTKKFVKESRDVNPTVRTPELENSTMDLIDGKITREQHLKNVDEFKPVDPWDALPREPSNKATVFSLKPNQRKDGFFVLPESEAERLGVVKSALAVGQRFLGRLDIPAYKDYDTWIVAGKSPKGEKGTVYAKAIHYGSEDGKPVVFRASQGKSENIGKGKADPNYHPDTHEKTGYATVDGIVQDLDVDSIRAKAAQYLNDPEWTQVGFDPRRQGGFYVRAGDNKHVPVREASEVIQIGPLVLARNAKLDFEHTGYAEGGAVMDKQMELLFDEGGISDDGMNVDPVSGNEIPPGSMASEVRDDIPAQLSEGEYVVPADVTRFFGVKFFEDLRAEAKRGLMAMEANGRIGGEPVGMEDPRGDEGALTPEEMAVLEEMGMAIGGFVQQSSPVAMGNTGYAEGGLEDGTTPTFDPSMFTAGYSFRPPSTTQAPTVTTVMLYSPDGLTTQAFSLPAQQTEYDAKLAEGWSTTQVQTPEVTTETSVDKDDGPVKPTTGKDNKPFSEMTPDELKEAYSSNLKARTLMRGMALINPVLGLAGLGAIKFAESQIIQNMKDKRVDIPDPEEDSNILSWFSETFGIKKDEEPTLLRGRDMSITPAGATTASAMSQAQVQEGIDYAETGDDRDDSWDGGQVAVNQTAPDVTSSAAESQAAAQAAADELGVPLATGGRAKGGLMQKKKKK